MVIEFLDGPLIGTIHEVAGGFPVPNKLCTEPDQNGIGHWYIVNDDKTTANYERSEKREAY
jgi:hypothetical protein